MEAIESFSERKLRVLFLGYYDSVRTHIAKAFLQDLYGEHFEAYSGGVEIREPSQYAINVMAEIGIDLSSYTPENIDDIIGKEFFDYVVTLCDEATEVCPYFPGGKKYIHTSIEDPDELKGTEAKIMEGYRRIRSKLKKFIDRTFGEELRKRKIIPAKRMLEIKKKPAALLDYVSEPVPIDRILKPFKEFAKKKASGGLLLILCIIAALALANTLGGSFIDFWHTHVTIGIGSLSLSKPLHSWINDGLMAVFFFVIGLEIKREGLVGELTSLRKAILPIAAAMGGMILPITIFFTLNIGTGTTSGWAIPMATDIAIALGILTLLGKRVPYSLKVFLTAFAIVDDIGAVIVIAIFYTSTLSLPALVTAGFLILSLAIVNRSGVLNPIVYGTIGVCLWMAFLLSGIHATVAGVLLALTIPVKTPISDQDFLDVSRATLEEYERTSASGKHIMLDEERSDAVRTLGVASTKAQPLLSRFEHSLLPWVTFLILPIFALANAGVTLATDLAGTLSNPLTIGIVLGLVAGKQSGIFLFSWLAVKSGFTSLPTGVTWKHMYGTAWLGGVGFTMSIFIASLTFHVDTLLTMAKIGILLASFVSGLGGFLILRKVFSMEEINQKKIQKHE